MMLFVWRGLFRFAGFRAEFGDVPAPQVFPAIGPLSTREDLVSHILVGLG